MTSPLQRGVEPGESEFSHGKGLLPNLTRHPEQVADNRVMLRAIYQTDSANPDADALGTLVPKPSQSHTDDFGLYVPGNLATGMTPVVREVGPSSRVGQFKVIDPSKPKGGDKAHHADGTQDGSGQSWRDSQPPNPVT